MRYLLILSIFLSALTACKKETIIIDPTTIERHQDSLVRNIHELWKFKISVKNSAVNQKLGNWEEWRHFVNELTIAPELSISHLQHKAKNLVENVGKLRENIPELYDQNQTISRIALLETHVQNLDMHLEFEPIDQTEITKLLENIQKSTNSLLYQFDEFEIKAKIPKEEGENQAIQSIDTLKRATLNALPQE